MFYAVNGVKSAFVRSVLVTVVALCLVAGLSATKISAFAQSGVTPPIAVERANQTSVPQRTSNELIAGWNSELEAMEQAVNRDGITEQQLSDLSGQAGTIALNAGSLALKLQPEADVLRQRIEELGPVPGENDPAESEDTKARRDQLGVDFASVDGAIKAARLVQVRARQIERSIIEKRRDRFVSTLSERSNSVFDLPFWRDVALGFSGFNRGFSLLISDSVKVMVSRLSDNVFLASILFGAGAVFYALYLWLRSRLMRLGRRIAKADLSEDDTRTISAIYHFLRNGVLRVLLIFAVYWLLNRLGLLTDRLSQFLDTVVWAVSFVVLMISLGLAFLRPQAQDMRIADVSDECARRIMVTGSVALAFIAIAHIINATSIMLVSPFQVSVGMSAVSALVAVVATVWIIVSIARDRAESTSSVLAEPGLFSWVYLKPLFWLACILSAIALVFGYVAFAEFMAYQILIAALILGVLWLVLSAVDANKNQIVAARSERAKDFAMATGMKQATVKQFTIVGFGLAKLVILLAAAMALALPWGVRTSDWVLWTRDAFFGFQVGGLTISFSTILLALLLFVAGFLITRTVKNWFEGQFLPTTKLDAGLRNSIATMLGYVGFVIAVMLAISAAGLDLSNLAIVAGALSVGIGFGLQSIVNNFVSGLILLAERPIKAGDWVVTSGGEGTVKKISVRSTEIETFDRAMVIVPNSTLITDPVTNWTYRNKLGRVIITVGVGYNSDPEKVREILLEVAKANPAILGQPEPAVYLMDFGADALVFDLRCYLSDIEYGLSVRSELRFAILKGLRQANIEIPFPQRDLHIKSGLDVLTEAQTKAGAASAPASRTRRSTAAKKNPRIRKDRGSD